MGDDRSRLTPSVPRPLSYPLLLHPDSEDCSGGGGVGAGSRSGPPWMLDESGGQGLVEERSLRERTLPLSVTGRT